jgi:hypothetical protein
MDPAPLDILETPNGLVFKVHVQPRASRNRITGIFGDTLKVAVTAPPVDDAANRMVIRVLAEALQSPTGMFSILSGHTSRTKRIRWETGGGRQRQAEARQRLQALVCSGKTA